MLQESQKHIHTHDSLIFDLEIKRDLVFFVRFTHILYFKIITAALPDKRLAKSSRSSSLRSLH